MCERELQEQVILFIISINRYKHYSLLASCVLSYILLLLMFSFYRFFFFVGGGVLFIFVNLAFTLECEAPGPKHFICWRQCPHLISPNAFFNFSPQNVHLLSKPTQSRIYTVYACEKVLVAAVVEGFLIDWCCFLEGFFTVRSLGQSSPNRLLSVANNSWRVVRLFGDVEGNVVRYVEWHVRSI